MKAACWHGRKSLGIEEVPDPAILNPHDAIVRVVATTMCGSDLHIYNGLVPFVERGDILGHELVGEIVDVGTEVRDLRNGMRVVVSATISCGSCFFCKHEQFSLCENANPNAWLAKKVLGFAPGGLFGYTHLFGGYAGSFAQYVRVPFADVGCLPVPEGMADETALFLSEALPAGYMGADLCGIRPGDVVAVWGCGAVGQFVMQCARLLGAEKVIAIDRIPDRLRIAVERSGAIPLDYGSEGVLAELEELTGGRGPDACVDAVGMEAHGVGVTDLYDRTKHALRLETDRAVALRQMIAACRKGGTIVVMGLYVGMVDKLPMGIAMNKALTFRMGQLHGPKYARMALDRIESGELRDPSFAATHRMPLDQIGAAFQTFASKTEGCMRVVLRP